MENLVTMTWWTWWTSMWYEFNHVKSVWCFPVSARMLILIQSRRSSYKMKLVMKIFISTIRGRVRWSEVWKCVFENTLIETWSDVGKIKDSKNHGDTKTARERQINPVLECFGCIFCRMEIDNLDVRSDAGISSNPLLTTMLLKHQDWNIQGSGFQKLPSLGEWNSV